jgi:hypothetical protein
MSPTGIKIHCTAGRTGRQGQPERLDMPVDIDAFISQAEVLTRRNKE